MRVGAVVAAAGFARRMGREKVLLPLGSTTVLERVLSSLAAVGIVDIAVVVRPDATAARGISERAGARVVENPRPQEDLLSSIRLGLDALDPALEAVFVWPADHPLVQTQTLERLLGEASADRAVLPAWRGRRGHPALVGGALRREIATRPLPGGLRDLWRERAESVVEVPVEDEGILLDLDTPEDYRRALTRAAEDAGGGGRR
jgi:CTP:molybdopterin cytidylyltransferase MocA